MSTVKLLPHQQEVLKQTDGLNKVAYYLDMGLGKTFVGSEKMLQRNKRVNLVICQKSKVNDWFNHFVENYSDMGMIFNNLTNKLEFEYFMDVLGIECELISGTANNGNGTWVGHAWNKVKIDGKWLYIDVTWDDPIPDRGANVYWYKYYLVTDATFGGDHRADN